MQEDNIRISAIIPMYNAEMFIERCVAPLLAMRARDEIAEIIVVDDRSTDGGAQIVRRYSQIRLIATGAQGGPGAARNLGTSIATGTHFWFVDSDVVVADDAARILHLALGKSRAAAVIGSYDEQPDARNFLSQYKNLVHHYYHQRGKAQASTFWGGCGAVEKEIFVAVGGFDARRYYYPSIEDIELGYRIGDAGGAIALEPRLQGKHLKRWKLVNLIHTDVFRRALPWSRLMLQRSHVTNDLNVSNVERLRALLTLTTAASVILWALGWVPGIAPILLAGCLLVANLAFVRFFVRTRGILFAVRAFLFHQVYYLYSSAAFATAVVEHRLKRLRPRSKEAQ